MRCHYYNITTSNSRQRHQQPKIEEINPQQHNPMNNTILMPPHIHIYTVTGCCLCRKLPTDYIHFRFKIAIFICAHSQNNTNHFQMCSFHCRIFAVFNMQPSSVLRSVLLVYKTFLPCLLEMEMCIEFNAFEMLRNSKCTTTQNTCAANYCIGTWMFRNVLFQDLVSILSSSFNCFHR